MSVAFNTVSRPSNQVRCSEPSLRHSRCWADLVKFVFRWRIPGDRSLLTQFLCCAICIPREPRRDPSNRGLYEHGKWIRHCQESNPQPVPSQVRTYPSRQWRTAGTDASKVMELKTSYYRHWCHPTSRRGPRSRSLLLVSSHDEIIWGPGCHDLLLPSRSSAIVTSRLVSALVISRLDYCNSVLAHLPASTLAPLQRVVDAAARMFVNLEPRGHETSALHWLPIAERIKFKLSLLVHHVIFGRAPSFLTELFTSVANVPARASLRSAGRIDLVVQRSRLVSSERFLLRHQDLGTVCPSTLY